MKLVVFSHKLVWENPDSAIGYATDGGFAFHMKAISEIFDETVVAVPVSRHRKSEGEVLFEGHKISIFPLKDIKGSGLKRKFNYIFWFINNIIKLNKLINQADAVHSPIPSDIASLGMVLATIKRKPLFVRYCGNWNVQSTRAERIWRWFMEKYAGGSRVMLATGMQAEPPSLKNPNIKWIFSSSLSRSEIEELNLNPPVLDIIAPRLVIVCRMIETKGPGKMIETLQLLKDEYPGIHLDLVGEGEHLARLKLYAKENDLDKHVTFRGKLNHEGVLKVLKNAHIFCFPTKSEGFPKAVLEALACGLPVIANPVSAIPALLNNGGGILLKNDDAETIAQELRGIFRNPDRYKYMQTKAFERAEGFSLEKWRDSIKFYLDKGWGIS